MRREEYGGYLPFETRVGEDYFSRYGEAHILRTNSGKAAIYYALKAAKPRKVYAPHYLCDSVRRMLADSGIEVEQFYLDEEMLPRLWKVEKGAAVLLVNYYGVMEEQVRKAAGQFSSVIIDNAHAFFAEPILRESVWNVYSCRKFVGVPDGGYLVSASLPGALTPGTSQTGTLLSEALTPGASMVDASGVHLEPDCVSAHFSYLTTSMEYGMNAAYQEKQDADRYFYGNYAGMSRISRSMLSTADYAYIREKREENYSRLHEKLKDVNQLKLPDTVPAWLYPFWPGERGADLRKELVAEKIYTPTLWRELIRPDFEGTLEYRLSREVIFLPVDQRYDCVDMEELAGRVTG
ncbi:MAG: hypothetical protein LUH53_04380 [Lachnospiraceae bacterium]|nr:hypothetical protein [Lachnospiraceae bacterium]